MLDIKLTTFSKVVELGSYTAAAAAMHLSQPAVTQHISKLEQYYGCRFFAPEGRSMRLTEKGKRFYHYARMQLANEQQLAGLQRPMTLGSTLSIADYCLTQLLIPLVQEAGFAPHITVGNTELLLGRTDAVSFMYVLEAECAQGLLRVMWRAAKCAIPCTSCI